MTVRVNLLIAPQGVWKCARELFQHTLFLCLHVLLYLGPPHCSQHSTDASSFNSCVSVFEPRTFSTHYCMHVSNVLYKHNRANTCVFCFNCFCANYSIYLWLTLRLTHRSVAEIWEKLWSWSNPPVTHTNKPVFFMTAKPTELAPQHKQDFTLHHYKSIYLLI